MQTKKTVIITLVILSTLLALFSSSSILSATAQESLLLPPSLLSPSNGVTSVPTTSSFQWNAALGANRYWLVVTISASALPPDTKHAYLVKQVTNVTLTLYVHENSTGGPVIAGAQVTGQDGAGISFSQGTNSSGCFTGFVLTSCFVAVWTCFLPPILAHIFSHSLQRTLIIGRYLNVI